VKPSYRWAGVLAKRLPDTAVLDRLRDIAAIRENPYYLLYDRVAAKQGERIPITGSLDRFDSRIISAVYVTHLIFTLSSSKELKTRKQIARCSQELAGTLKALTRGEKQILIHFLDNSSQATFDDFIAATQTLAIEARRICSLAKGPKSMRHKREAKRLLVNALLDAAADAGGNLTLNQRSERGTLIDAIEVLLPYLPKEISERSSFSTLRRLREPWAQNRENNSAERGFEPSSSRAMSAIVISSSEVTGHAAEQDEALPLKGQFGRQVLRI
jgi:hypothetical protein